MNEKAVWKGFFYPRALANFGLVTILNEWDDPPSIYPSVELTASPRSPKNSIWLEDEMSFWDIFRGQSDDCQPTTYRPSNLPPQKRNKGEM